MRPVRGGGQGEAAVIEPYGFERWNRALQGAYRKGWAAAEAGQTEDDCPYEDKRKPSGKLSWSRSFIRAWHDGWAAASRQNPAAPAGNPRPA